MEHVALEKSLLLEIIISVEWVWHTIRWLRVEDDEQERSDEDADYSVIL